MNNLNSLNSLDLICRRMTGKGLPLLVIRHIYELIHCKNKKPVPYLIDNNFVERGARYSRKNTKGFQTNIRYRRAFRYGR